MHYLVIGSAGFIGRHLVRALLAAGHTVTGYDRRPHPEPVAGLDARVHDLFDDAGLRAACAGVDRIVHLAAEHQDFGVLPGEYERVNGDGTRILVQAATLAGVREFVFFSSVAVYGDRDEPSTESSVPAPSSPYGASKLAAECLLRRWAAAETTRSVLVVRPTVVYGPWNLANMFRLMDTIARGRYVQIGDGGNVKSIIYIENLVAATMFLMRQMSPGFDFCNAVDERQLSSRQIALAIADALGVRLRGLQIPRELACVMASPLDVIARVTGRNLPITASRIRKFTSSTVHLAPALAARGFVAPVDPLTGIARMAAWFQEYRK